MIEPGHGSLPLTTARPGLRLAAAHMDRPARPPAGSQWLDRLLLGLSWARPSSRELAEDAIMRLVQTQSALAECADPVLTAANVRRGLDALCARIGFVLEHWTGELRSLGSGWDTERADALTADLAEIARTGAAIRDLLDYSTTKALPDSGLGAMSGSARHCRGFDQAPWTPSPRAVGGLLAAIGQLPPSTARLVIQTAGFVTAAALATAVCVLAFDHSTAVPDAPARRAGGLSRPSTPGLTGSGRTKLDMPSASNSPVALGVADSLQIQLLGASAAQPRIEVVVYLDTATTAPVTVAISYRAEGETYTAATDRTAVGGTYYQFALSIDAAAYCDRAVLVAAEADGLSASQSTSAGPCATSSGSPSTNAGNA